MAFCHLVPATQWDPLACSSRCVSVMIYSCGHRTCSGQDYFKDLNPLLVSSEIKPIADSSPEQPIPCTKIIIIINLISGPAPGSLSSWWSNLKSFAKKFIGYCNMEIGSLRLHWLSEQGFGPQPIPLSDTRSPSASFHKYHFLYCLPNEKFHLGVSATCAWAHHIWFDIYDQYSLPFHLIRSKSMYDISLL